MDKSAILEIVKISLHLNSTGYDPMLNYLIDQAKKAMETEGINVDWSDTGDAMLTVQYTAYLFDKRRENTGMPRNLRWQLNNRLLSEKMKDGGEDA